VGARTKQNEVLMTSASRQIEERSAEYKERKFKREKAGEGHYETEFQSIPEDML